MNTNGLLLEGTVDGKRGEEDQGIPGSVTSETRWNFIMETDHALRLESHKIAVAVHGLQSP